MLAEISAECSAESPVLVVPWQNGISAFVDLRAHPDAVDHIPEAEAHPPLMQALRALNSSRSPIFTAKCDAWPLTTGELDDLRLHLDLTAEEASAGFASYLDLLWRDRTVFASMHRQQQILERIARCAAPLDHPSAVLELTLRPAMLDLAGAQEGFATTLYVKALGANEAEAWQHWGAALKDVVALLRGRDLSGAA